MREIRMSGSTSGKWKRGKEQLVRHRQTKEPETDRLFLNHRATSRLYQVIYCGTGYIRPDCVTLAPIASKTYC